jgi:ISXO2-like transposase domain
VTLQHSVRDDVSTNTVEGYFSIFKRGMRGVYQHCQEKHLHRYLVEYDFATIIPALTAENALCSRKSSAFRKQIGVSPLKPAVTCRRGGPAAASIGKTGSKPGLCRKPDPLRR